MPPNREPPDRLPVGAEPELTTLAKGETFFRIHDNAYGPTEFNPTVSSNPYRGGRFDSSDGSYSYLYAGRDLPAAAAEALLRHVPASELGGDLTLPWAAVENVKISRLTLQRDVEVVSLHGPGLFRLAGQDSWLTSSESREFAQTRHWAGKIREWAPDAAGFEWRSRVDNDKFCYVFFGDRMMADTLAKHGQSSSARSAFGRHRLDAVLAPYGVSISAPT